MGIALFLSAVPGGCPQTHGPACLCALTLNQVSITLYERREAGSCDVDLESLREVHTSFSNSARWSDKPEIYRPLQLGISEVRHHGAGQSDPPRVAAPDHPQLHSPLQSCC